MDPAETRTVVATLMVAVLALAAVAASSDEKVYAASLRDQPPSVSVQVVVARYAEDVSWLRNLPFHDVVVYDKNNRGDTSAGNPPPYATVVPLPNVGRCDHTYLYHIVHNWDRLADVTVFVPGSCAFSPSKWNKLEWVTRHVCKEGSSAFPLDLVTRLPLWKELGDFEMSTYQATGAANARHNPESELKPCSHRPFGNFFVRNFPELPPARGVVYQGVFAVARGHIRQHNRARYARLLRHVDDHSNPEAGHYLERSWLAAFHPVPPRCTELRDWSEARSNEWIVFVGVTTLVCLLVWRAVEQP